jgi:hypothetical protein
MGAKTALLVYSDQHPAALLRKAPILDRDAASALVAATHPGWTGTGTSTESLSDCVYPPDGIVYAGLRGRARISSGERLRQARHRTPRLELLDLMPAWSDLLT